LTQNLNAFGLELLLAHQTLIPKPRELLDPMGRITVHCISVPGTSPSNRNDDDNGYCDQDDYNRQQDQYVVALKIA
jgi:hypothetical protein